MDNKIKEKVREIQDKYCGASVETKLYHAIKETMDKLNKEDSERIKPFEISFGPDDLGDDSQSD